MGSAIVRVRGVSEVRHGTYGSRVERTILRSSFCVSMTPDRVNLRVKIVVIIRGRLGHVCPFLPVGVHGT